MTTTIMEPSQRRRVINCDEEIDIKLKGEENATNENNENIIEID